MSTIPLDPKNQVRADVDADSGIVEVFPLDPQRSGFMLGLRCDVGPGAFVHVSADQAEKVAALLTARPEEETTAQDVVDALRFILIAQKHPGELVKIVKALVEMAPEADGDRALKLLLDLICAGSLKVALTVV